MDISIYVKKYLCNNLNNFDKYIFLKEKYNKKVKIIEKILSFFKNKVSNEKEATMTKNIKINHFNLELDKINKKYKNDFNNLNSKLYEEKKIKFMNIIAIFKDYMLLHLNNLKNKDCNEYLLFNLLLEDKLKLNISKFSIEKFFEIVNLACKILSSKIYFINYS